jgi:hypothetical protein
MLAEVIEMRRLNAVNASDGAFIPGAVPRVAEAIEPGAEPLDHAAIKAALFRALNEIEPADIFAETDMVATAEHAERLFTGLDDMLATFADGEPDFAGVYTAVRSFLDKTGATYGRTESIVAGTLIALPRIAMFFGFRVDDLAVRKDLFSLFIKEFRKTAKEMKEGTAKLFERLIALAEPTLEGERRRA